MSPRYRPNYVGVIVSYVADCRQQPHTVLTQKTGNMYVCGSQAPNQVE